MSTFALTNANTGKVEKTYESVKPAEIPGILEASDKAFHEWKSKSVADRAAVLAKAASLFRERAGELRARSFSGKQSRPLPRARR